MNPRRLPIIVLAAAAACLAGPYRTALSAESPVHSIERASALDRDGDGEVGEAWAIQQRVRLYVERHGENGRIDPAVQLRRARLGYERWLDQERGFRTKGATDDTFVSLGPNNGAGRAVSIAPHPSEIGTLLVGFAGGGVWRTRDAGETWEPLTDGMPDLSTGAVAYAPSDPDIVYVGTGEGGYGIDFIAGIGLLRSDDGGDTWTLPDEVVASQFYAISVDPRDPDTLLAGTNEGLIRSTDGGVTWSTPIPAKPGGHQRELVVTDVVRSHQNPDLLYAALWCFDNCPAGMGRVMRSTDGGVTWAAADNGLPEPTSSWGLNRIALALSPDHDDVLVVGMNRSGSGPPAEIWRTDDGGASWRKLGNTDPFLGGQGWYDNTISIRPGGTDFIMAAGVYYVFTTNGGASWLTRNPYITHGLPHVDFHDIEWQAGTLWVACDGGVWKSPDSGSTWIGCNSGLITRQYYGMDIDPIHRERVFAGAQDNGTNRRRDTGDDAWDEVLGGDGFECGVNQLVPDIVYGTVYSTQIYRSTNGGDDFRNVSPRYGQDENAPFLTPLTLHPLRPWELLTGTTRVWRSPDGGDSWQPLPTEVGNGSWNQSTVAAVAATRADGRVLMVAKGSDVYRSTDGGSTWRQTARGDGGLPGYRVLNVEISPFDASVALACLGTTSGTPVYRTTDGGITWTPSADGLPTFPVQVARWDPTDPDVVYAGSDLGLYRSTDGGVTWQPYGSGLPSASVQDIRILPDGSMLRIATHGRGVWGLEIPHEPNQPPAVEITSGNGGVVIVDVDGSASFSGRATDPDGDTLTTRWVFTDDWSTVNGSSGEGTVETSVTHTFPIGGTYNATLIAADGRGGQALASAVVRVDDASNYCESARTVPANGPFPVTLLGNNTVAGSSSKDPHPPCVSNPDDPKVGTWGSMWFEFTPEESHTYAISTCGSGADTVLSVWTGPACGPFTPVTAGCNDDDEIVHCAGARTDSYVEVDLEAGTTYRIMVGSYDSGGKGRFKLTIDCADCPHPLPERLYLLPAAARSNGSNGTFWRTDLILTNTEDEDVPAALAFLEAGHDNTNADEVQVTVPAHGSLELADVVGTVLGASGSGAVRILSQGDLLVSSRTYTDSENGTFGQYIPGERAETGIGTGGDARLLGLADDAAYRTNVGLVNTTDRSVTASIELLDGAGALLGTESVRLEPFGWKQLNRIFSSNGFEGLDTAQAVVRTTGGDGAVIPYASVVDNVTGDPVYVAPVRAVSAGADLWIAAAAHVAGYNGSLWRTDLTVASTGDVDASVRVQYLPADSDNGSPAEATLDVPAGGAVLVPDVLGALFGAEGAGALRLIAESGTIQAVSRTYNQTAEGTFGQFIPGVPSTDGIGEGNTGILVGLRKDAAFHTNVGVVNLTGAPVEAEITYTTADGTQAGTENVTLPPFAFHQENRAIPGSPEGPVTATVRCTTAGGLILAYGSVVDDASGDPIFVPAIPTD